MMQQGEKYQCTNEDCGCEISVTKASQIEEAEAQNPTCCCGEEMELMESGARGASSRGAGTSGRSRT
jgi:hypothetical protein